MMSFKLQLSPFLHSSSIQHRHSLTLTLGLNSASCASRKRPSEWAGRRGLCNSIQARNLFVLQEVLLRKHLSPFVIYRFFPLLFPWLQTYLLNLVKTISDRALDSKSFGYCPVHKTCSFFHPSAFYTQVVPSLCKYLIKSFEEGHRDGRFGRGIPHH